MPNMFMDNLGGGGDVSKADVQNNAFTYAADTGSTDAYAITLASAPTAYTAGMVVHFKANTANTGACTLNVNGLGAVAIKKLGGTKDLSDDEIKAGQIVTVVYDGTNFQMIGRASAKGTMVNAYMSAQQTLTTTTFTLMHLDLSVFDRNSEFTAWNGSSGARVTVKESGLYLLIGAVKILSPAADSRVFARIKKNGTDWIAETSAHASTANNVAAQGLELVELAQNDYLELYGYHDSSSDKVADNNQVSTFLVVTKVSD